jgi:hypothetical protein
MTMLHSHPRRVRCQTHSHRRRCVRPPHPTCVICRVIRSKKPWHTQMIFIPKFELQLTRFPLPAHPTPKTKPPPYLLAHHTSHTHLQPTTSIATSIQNKKKTPSSKFHNSTTIHIMTPNNKDQSHSIPAPTSGSRSKLLSTNFKSFLSKPAVTHPQKVLTVELHNADVKSSSGGASSEKVNCG